MIRKLTGKLDSVGQGYVVLEVGGIGYRVFATEVTVGRLAKLFSEEEAVLFIYTHVREDQLALYGFETKEELDLFELLISISGVGPKAAINILTIATPSIIKNAVLKNDISPLTKVSGIGKKTAERIVLELQNKVEQISPEKQQEAESGQEVIEALMAMGYSAAEAREAIKQIPSSIKDESERIKLALKAMRK
ncbi:MAG TPA: Holliday junction branch migration protein RuvA [Candidatus Moranbacteria bacterium]|nr:Holliday junction branch migration protein RuvA [Candidatus Moranbacteria bacterium]